MTRKPRLDRGGASFFAENDRPSLSFMIRDSLRAEILSGVLKPGQPLRQEELAERFRTSRVPLREALQSLQAEGLVALRPRRGYAVFACAADDLRELMCIRVLIESYCAYAGATGRAMRDVPVLAALLADMERLPARLSREHQRCRWWSLDREFHRTVFTSNGRAQLGDIFDSVTMKLDPYLLADQRLVEDRGAAMAEHRRILNAFAAGDARQVALLSRRHAEALAASFIAGLGQADGDSVLEACDLGPAASLCEKALAQQQQQPLPRRRLAASG